MTAKTKKTAPQAQPEFIITRDLDAPRELVWKACTEAQRLAQWWGPKGFTTPVCEWEARPGNKIYVVMRAPDGTDYPMGGQFHEVNPPERLVTTTGALDGEGNFLFQFRHVLTLTEHEGKTRLTMHSMLIETTPEADKYVGGFEAGMTQSLERLGELVKSTAQPLTVERTFGAPVNLVWRSLTNVDHMRRWYFDLAEFKAEVGFEFKFTVEHQGTQYCHLCKVTEVIPEKRIAYTWRYEGQPGNSLVTFDLVAEGDKTRLKLTHEGLETFPQTEAYARKNFERGWTMLVGSALKDYVEAADREIFITRNFEAPRELVWQAMTDPRHVVNWWGPRGFTTTLESMDFRVGGVWKQVMRGPDGANYQNEHVFMEIEAPERIVFSHGGKRKGGPSVSSVATWTFEALSDKKTRVSMRMVFPSTAERDFVVQEFHAVEGGKQTLERLGEYLATM